MNKDIIRIAEAMNLRVDVLEGSTVAVPLIGVGTESWHIWNPLASHDDCHALIEWLNGRGKIVRTEEGPDFCNDEVRIWHFGMAGKPMIWTGKDYRIGVVELTLKILDESDA